MTLVRCPRNLTRVYINYNLAELVSLCVVLLKVTEPTNDIEDLLSYEIINELVDPFFPRVFKIGRVFPS